MAYASETLSLATLELLVHLPAKLAIPNLVAIGIRVPEQLAVETWAPEQLPPGWDAQVPSAETQELGTRWIESGKGLLLRVPSVLIPWEWNVLIHPGHPDFEAIEVSVRPFAFDPRLHH